MMFLVHVGMEVVRGWIELKRNMGSDDICVNFVGKALDKKLNLKSSKIDMIRSCLYPGTLRTLPYPYLDQANSFSF